MLPFVGDSLNHLRTWKRQLWCTHHLATYFNSGGHDFPQDFYKHFMKFPYTRKNAQPVQGWWTMLCCPRCSMLSTILFSIVTHDCGLIYAQQCWTILLTTLNNVGSTGLFKAVFINPEQVVRYLLCTLDEVASWSEEATFSSKTLSSMSTFDTFVKRFNDRHAGWF